MSSEICCEVCLFPGSDSVPSLGVDESPETDQETHAWRKFTTCDSDDLKFSPDVRLHARNESICGFPGEYGTNESDCSHGLGESEWQHDNGFIRTCKRSEIPKSAERLSANAKNVSLLPDRSANVCQTSDEKPLESKSAPCLLREVKEPYTPGGKACELQTVADEKCKVLPCNVERCRWNSEKSEGECIAIQAYPNTDVNNYPFSNRSCLLNATCINSVARHHQCESDDDDGLGQDNCIDCCDVVFKDGIEYCAHGAEHHLNEIMKLIGRDLSEPYSVYTYRYFIYNWPHLCIRVCTIASVEFKSIMFGVLHFWGLIFIGLLILIIYM
jgi:hypothetical protein